MEMQPPSYPISHLGLLDPTFSVNDLDELYTGSLTKYQTDKIVTISIRTKIFISEEQKNCYNVFLHEKVVAYGILFLENGNVFHPSSAQEHNPAGELTQV